MNYTMEEIDVMDAEDYSTFLSEGDPIVEELTPSNVVMLATLCM